MTHGQGASTDEQESRRNRDTGDNDDDDDDFFGNIEGINHMGGRGSFQASC